MRGSFIPCLVLLTIFVSTPLFAAETQSEPVQSVFSLRWENDTFGMTDANYTNGISASLIRADQGLLGGIWGFLGVDSGRKSTVYELTQLQFTPSNTEQSAAEPNDRPYAGITYLGCTTHLQGEGSLQSLKLLVGVVGSASGAAELQKFSHRILGDRHPKGWSHQLRDETVVNIQYEYRHKYQLSPRDATFGIELIPMGGAFLGNYLTQAQSDVLLRIGYQMPDDFGTTSLRGIGYLPLPKLDKNGYSWGINTFVRGGANLVARNLTLDGNTFAQSQHVGKRLIVPVMEVGTALWTRWFMTSVSYQLWGREFNNQPFREGYGSILLSLRF